MCEQEAKGQFLVAKEQFLVIPESAPAFGFLKEFFM
jgi:hypothetical protein